MRTGDFLRQDEGRISHALAWSILGAAAILTIFHALNDKSGEPAPSELTPTPSVESTVYPSPEPSTIVVTPPATP